MSVTASVSADLPPEPSHRPLARSERIALLDVLRGFALGGILLANVHIFSTYLYRDIRGDVPTTAADQGVLWLTHLLIDGKFYSLFSLLFGIGFYIFMERAAAKGIPAVPLFRRRLGWLFAIGAVHAVLIWAGDILTVYAVVGLVLVFFRDAGSRTLLRWAAVMLALPVVAYAVALAAGGGGDLLTPPAAGADAAGGFDPLSEIITGYAGSYPEVFRGNAIALVGRWMDLVVTLRFPKVLALFLIGFWVGRAALARDVATHAPLLRRVLVLGLVIGLPANAFTAGAGVPYLPPTVEGLIGVAANGIGVPALALAYAAAIALLMRGALAQRVLGVLAPVGRMALTNYVMQSVVCGFIFFGYGLGLAGRVGPAQSAAIALAVFAAQVPLSAWWLRRFEWGPAEWLWRRLTYGASPARSAGEPRSAGV